MSVSDQNPTILVVEDDDVDYMSFRRQFLKTGIAGNLARAVDGVEGLEMLKSGQVKNPLIVVLDINMPRMNGIELLQAIRSDANFSSLVVFILTTSQNDVDQKACYAHNVAGYIVKEDADSFKKAVELIGNYSEIVRLPD